MSINRKRKQRRERRAERTHTKVRMVSDKPRLSVFRSLKHFYAQVIDDKGGKTICSSSTATLTTMTGDKKAQAKEVGLALAKLAVENKVKEVSFDRGRFLYHGRVKAFAEGAREGGLQF